MSTALARFATFALVVLAAFVLPGPAAAQAATEPAAKAPKKPLIIGMPVTPPNLPHIGVYIAKDLGYFDEEGIALDLKGFESGLQSLRGGVAGGLDILGASSEPVIKAISRGAKFRSIFSYAHKLTVVMVAQEGIKSPKELRGKILGIQDVGAFREVMTRAVLHNAGLTPNDAQYVPVSSAGYISGLIGGKIDTAILHIDQAHMAQTKKASLHVLVPLWELM
ncbi:MAG: ABC transporter substrate-binding protein, partial [Gemmatimonadales bacterium]